MAEITHHHSSHKPIAMEHTMHALDKISLTDSASLSAPGLDYIAHRMVIFDRLKLKYDQFVNHQEKKSIKITLADGRQFDGQSWVTVPFDIAKLLGTDVLNHLVIARVNGVLYDLMRPLEGDALMEFLDFDHPEGQSVFWHSSAHVLGEATETHYGCLLCHGPPTDDGFHYDLKNVDGRTVVPDDFPSLEKKIDKILKERQPFERLPMSKEDLLEMFKYNHFKVHFIKDKIPDGTSSTVYRCGTLIDLCLGPHITNTGRIKSYKLLKNSSSYFLGEASNEVLQRIYGIAFPDPKMMKEYIKFKEEAEKRDHRRLGREQQLFFFNDFSPGCCFYLPHGTRIYNTLVELMREEYRKRGFTEVITPTMFNSNLWKTSGHWKNYHESMFNFEVEKEPYALKPMNCPGHCIMFAHRERSYRELPIRFAEFGVVHRNELSGALSGLTRVRKFTQDDAHIFCRQDQIGSEIKGCLDFLDSIYSILGFKFSLRLATRPEKYMGELSVWDMAEKQLELALKEFGRPYEINAGDGAFYGPKIDITVMDAQRRRHQCATIQLDFQLPLRFELSYRTSAQGVSHEGDGAHAHVDGKCASEILSGEMERPVIIHRAILGSLERMIAIITESYGGRWPFWLSPRQIAVIPVSHATDEYAEAVRRKLHEAGFYVEADLSDLTFNKKIRNAEVSQVNFIFVVGAQEESQGTINARKASVEGKDVVLPIDKAIEALCQFKKARLLECFFS